jgi:CDP-diacylglycerol---glycerol-3-phosphate 3-phosphatidyltransferase
MIRDKIRAPITKFIEIPIAKLFNNIGVTPTQITIISLLISISGGVFVIYDNLLLGGLLFLFGSSLDLLDGTLSRLTNNSTQTGALLDSVFDRLGEAFMMLSLIILSLSNLEEVLTPTNITQSSDSILIVLTVVALISSQTVSYVRARGESLNVDMKPGLITRPERVLLISLGLVTNYITLAVAIVALFSIVTLIQRLVNIIKALK